MTPSLLDTLRALSEALPGRFRLDWDDTDPEDVWLAVVEARRGQRWEEVWWGGRRPQPRNPEWLEYALREKCAARGWTWSMETMSDGRAYALIMTDALPAAWMGRIGDTPAHALCLALCLALLSALQAAHAQAVAQDRQAHPESPLDVTGAEAMEP